MATVKPAAWFSQVAIRVTVRGDTDFTHTDQLDRWNEHGVRFVLGFDLNPQLVVLAHGLASSAWQRLERMPRYKILTEPRAKGVRYKEQILVEKEFYNQKLVGEVVAEMEYQPGKCGYPTGWLRRCSASMTRVSISFAAPVNPRAYFQQCPG